MSTKIICHVMSCKHCDDSEPYKNAGICKCETIRLQGCTPDADNVVACSEYEERDKAK